MKRKKASMDVVLQNHIEEYRQTVADGPLSIEAIAIWILRNDKFRPTKQETIKLLMKHLSHAMTTHYVTAPDGMRLRRKHAVRHKTVGPDGKKQMVFTWYDIELAPPHFMFESIQQRRDSIADVCWQVVQDREGYNKYYNKSGQPIPAPVVDFREDMAERQAMLNYRPPDDSELNL